MKSRIRPLVPLLLCGTLWIHAAPSASAATKTWNGGTTSWGVAGNWTASGIPVAADDVVFTGASPSGFGVDLGAANRSVTSLTFDSTATSSYVINLGDGTSLPFANVRTLNVGGGITVNAGSHAIQGSNANSELTLNSGIFNIAAGSTLTFNARLGAGNVSNNYTKTGDGTLVFGATNSNSGGWNFSSGATGFTVAAGVLKFAASGAAGNSSNKFAVSSGATLELAAAGAYNATGGTLTLNGAGVGGTGALFASSSSSIGSGSGSVVLASSSTIGVASGQTLTINQLVTGSGSVLTKSGGGTLDLRAANLYTGNTRISDGFLLANNGSGSATGTGSVTVDGAAARVGGTGTLGALTVTTGSVSPGGVASGSTGILSTGSLTLTALAAYQAAVNSAAAGGGYDQLNVTGAVTLDGALNLSVGGGLVNGDLLFILANDGADAVNGTFAGLAEGALFSAGGLQFQITYQANYDSAVPANNSFTGGNDVALLALVPEPSTACLAALGALPLLRRRRPVRIPN